jgi:galacturonosyltransferase
MADILILANDHGTLYNFRRELLARLIVEGHQVTISVPRNPGNHYFVTMGCKLDESPLSRSGLNPIKELQLWIHYVRLIKKLKPQVVLTFTAKPNVFGSLACQFCNVPYINNVTGLGSMLQEETLVKRVIEWLQKLAYRKSSHVFFQNLANRQYFLEKKIVGENSSVLPGSGVNLTKHSLEPYTPDGTIRFIVVSRLRQDKGYDELFEAIKEISGKGYPAEFHIVGGVEEKKYLPMIEEMLENFPVIYHGSKTQEEVQKLIADSHCLIHPSWHEGMANVILEAAATGRPCLASNIPGCSEAIENGKTGFLFEVKNQLNLANTIIRFIDLSLDQKVKMGESGRTKIEKSFDRKIVVNKYINKINKVLTLQNETQGCNK